MFFQIITVLIEICVSDLTLEMGKFKPLTQLHYVVYLLGNYNTQTT